MNEEKDVEELVEEEEVITDEETDVKVEESPQDIEEEIKLDETVPEVNEEINLDEELSKEEVPVEEVAAPEEEVVTEDAVEPVVEPVAAEQGLPPEENVVETPEEIAVEPGAEGEVEKPGGKKKLIFGVIILLVIGALVFFFLDNSEEEIVEEKDDTLITAFNNMQEADSFVVFTKENLYNNDRAILLDEFVVWYDFENDYIYYASEENEKYFTGVEEGRANRYFLDDEEYWVEEEIPGVDLPMLQTVLLDGLLLNQLEDYLEDFTENEENEYLFRVDDYDFRVFEEIYSSEDNEADMLEFLITVEEDYISNILVVYYENDEKQTGFELIFSDINETVIELPEIIEREEEEEEEDISQLQTIFRSNALLLLTTARNVYNEAVLAGEEIEAVEYIFPHTNDSPRLDVEAVEPISGSIVVSNEGVIHMAFYDEMFCAYKSYNSDTVNIVLLDELPETSACTVPGLIDTGEGNPPFEKSEE